MPEKNIKSLTEKLFSVMCDVNYVQKEDKKVNNQYTFVSHDAVTKKIRGALIKHRVFCSVDQRSCEQDGSRTTVQLQVTFINVDNSQDKLIVNSFGQGVDNQDKGIGKAVSYAFKYALLKTFMLETGDDPEKDNEDYKTKEQLAVELFETNKEKLVPMLQYMADSFENNDKIKFDKTQFQAKRLGSTHPGLQEMYINAVNMIKVAAQEAQKTKEAL